MKVDHVRILRRGGLQQVVLAHAREGKVRRRYEREQALRCAIDRNLLPRATRIRAGRKRGGGKGFEDRGAGEAAAALRSGRHDGICIHWIRRRLVLVVDEEIGSVAAVVDVRNLQRTTQVASYTLVVMGDLRRGRSRDRIGTGIERGIFIAIVKAEAQAIRLLAKQPAASGTSASAEPPATTTWKAAAGQSDSLSLFAASCTSWAAKTSRPVRRPRSRAPWSACPTGTACASWTECPGIKAAGPPWGAGRQTLADSPLQ